MSPQIVAENRDIWCRSGPRILRAWFRRDAFCMRSGTVDNARDRSYNADWPAGARQTEFLGGADVISFLLAMV